MVVQVLVVTDLPPSHEKMKKMWVESNIYVNNPKGGKFE